ncbi:MAG: YebC/PmpR family DNA-binding transcriptional regulator [Actinomycetota bacterium]
MSGHSKWSTIKRKKEATDQKRSKMFAKLLRAIEVAAREGGGSVEGNMTLASAVEKAKEASVPSENIERAIKRGAGELEGARYEEVTYEGYGPGGVAVLVEALTDNRNRTGQEIRHAFAKLGGNMGDPGSVAWMFQRRGVILVEKDSAPEEEQLLDVALEAGADDLSDEESHWEITTEPSGFKVVSDALKDSGVTVVSAEITMQPSVTVPLEGSQAKSVLTLIDGLEDNDDVQNVYANFDIPEEVLAQVS